jgi:hypothetical protein
MQFGAKPARFRSWGLAQASRLTPSCPCAQGPSTVALLKG